ncbi:MAG: AGE family epimerase/isomerase [bacterium]
MNYYLLLTILLFQLSCSSGPTSKEQKAGTIPDRNALPDNPGQSLFMYIVDAWYPRCIDTLYGGYIPDFEYDWTMSKGPQNKALVQQARHLWSLSYLHEKYPERDDLLDYARTGYEFIRNNYWDKEKGGMFTMCSREGIPLYESMSYKRAYGQAFAIYGLSQYFESSRDSTALDLAKNIFYWLDENAHDKIHGGYFESLNRDGSPQPADENTPDRPGYLPFTGLKEFNSSIHILEAFTALYEVWPDELLRKRLEEIFILFRDTLIHPDGYLKLYFYADWTQVPEETMDSLSEGNYWYTQHVTYGHDVETAFLLLEAANVLEMDDDVKTQNISKKMVDHSLKMGWDEENGGFYYIGYKRNGKDSIHVDHKAWWVEAEGMNALMMMHERYPDDPMDYFGKFLDLWKYTNEYLIDKKYGGWYNYGLDTYPENRFHKKSHNWKASYHNVRGMVRVVERVEDGG